MVFLQLTEQIVPDMISSIVVQLLVAKRKMDARHKSLVKMTHPIRRKKEDSLEIIKRSQKY
jgi:hypothetical protein